MVGTLAQGSRQRSRTVCMYVCDSFFCDRTNLTSTSFIQHAHDDFVDCTVLVMYARFVANVPIGHKRYSTHTTRLYHAPRGRIAPLSDRHDSRRPVGRTPTKPVDTVLHGSDHVRTVCRKRTIWAQTLFHTHFYASLSCATR